MATNGIFSCVAAGCAWLRRARACACFDMLKPSSLPLPPAPVNTTTQSHLLANYSKPHQQPVPCAQLPRHPASGCVAVTVRDTGGLRMSLMMWSRQLNSS